MMTGYINENLEPLLEDIFIEGTVGDWIGLRTILDTGFNGEFCLPKHHVEMAQLEFLSEVEAELADGRVIIENVYLGTKSINNPR